MPPKLDVPYKNPAYDQIYAPLRGTPYYGKCPDMLIDEGKCVEEVWIREGERLSLIFKNTNDQPK